MTLIRPFRVTIRNSRRLMVVRFYDHPMASRQES